MPPKVSTKFLKEALETISKASTKNIKFTSMKNSANLSLDRVAGIRNRVFTGDPIFPKDVWQIPAFNTNSAYRLTGQSQIDDIIQTGFVRPRSGKIKGGHTNEVHWSAGNAKSGYNIQPGQYILETPRSLVDGTSNAIGVNDLSHVWTTRNGQIVDIINELRPSKLTLAERMGIPKGDRGNLTVDQLEGLEDLMHYNTSGKYRWRLNYNDKTGFTRTTKTNTPEGSIPGVKALLDLGAEPKTVIRYATKTGNWNVWPTRPNTPATFSGGDFPVPEGMGWAPGDLSLMLDGNSGKGLKVIMTSPRVDVIGNQVEGISPELINSLPNTIDKQIMRRFWQNNDQVVLPGSYLSGDNGALPLGLNGISAIDQGKGMSGAISEILHPARFSPHGSGLSPDSMLSILKQGQRPGHAVRYGPGFTQLNNSAVYNKHIYDAWTKYKSGAMTADEFKTIFDDWFVPQGGRPLEIRTPNKFRWARNNDGTKTLVQQDQTPYIVFPHPYVHYKKLGGKIK